MGKYLYGLDIQGKNKSWSFPVWANPKHVEEWREDGLVVDRILNVVPVWVVNLGLTKLWIFLQDLIWGGGE